MKSFRYVLDPLCIGGSTLYALNRWGIKPHTHIALFRFWLNDSLLIPCALPPVLMLHRWFGWRAHDQPPTAIEAFAHLAVWSVLFEVIGPRCFPHATGDLLDVVAYAAGGLISWSWWHRKNLFAWLANRFVKREF